MADELKPRCDLSNIAAGDAFSVVLRVATTLDRAGRPDLGSAYWNRAMIERNYRRALAIAREYVEVVCDHADG